MSMDGVVAAPPWTVFEAPTVEEAVASGLSALGLEATEAAVEILDRGSRGFLGLGARPARVAVAWQVQAEGAVAEFARSVIARMGLEAETEVVQVGREVRVTVRAGDADGLLIGRKGETLNAMQHVLTRMTGRRFPSQAPEIIVDVAGYRERRENQLKQLAESLAERVTRSGRRAMTEPLPSSERRIVHRALADIPGIETHTAGQGANKRVVLTASGKTTPPS